MDNFASIGVVPLVNLIRVSRTAKGFRYAPSVSIYAGRMLRICEKLREMAETGVGEKNVLILATAGRWLRSSTLEWSPERT
jgi:hypothetical protein